MKGDRERCLAAGMDGYVAKPLRPEKLFEAIGASVCSASPQRLLDAILALGDLLAMGVVA